MQKASRPQLATFTVMGMLCDIMMMNTECCSYAIGYKWDNARKELLRICAFRKCGNAESEDKMLKQNITISGGFMWSVMVWCSKHIDHALLNHLL